MSDDAELTTAEKFAAMTAALERALYAIADYKTAAEAVGIDPFRKASND